MKECFSSGKCRAVHGSPNRQISRGRESDHVRYPVGDTLGVGGGVECAIQAPTCSKTGKEKEEWRGIEMTIREDLAMNELPIHGNCGGLHVTARGFYSPSRSLR